MKCKLLIIPLIFILSLISVYADQLFLQNNVTEILEDTFIDQVFPDESFANETNIDIGEIGTDIRELFIKFNIGSIPIGSNITKAELGLFEFEDNTENIDDYKIFEVENQTWTEDEIKFNNQPLQFSLITQTSNPTLNADGFILFDVLSWVIREFNLSNNNVSFNLQKDLDSGGLDDTVKFRSREFQTVSERPFLNITFIIPVNQPPILNLADPSLNINNTKNNTIPLDIFFSATDDSLNDLTCLLRNTTTILDTGTFSQGTSFLTLAEGEIVLSQSFTDLNLSCFDNSLENLSSTLLLNITLDTVPPIIFLSDPIDDSSFNKQQVSSIRIRANCTDVPVFRFNISIRNESTNNLIVSFETKSPVNNILAIDEQLTISNFAAGSYFVNYTCSDPHTKRIINDYNIRKNDSDLSIRYDNEFRIKYLNNSLEITSYGTKKDISGDRYSFWFKTGKRESATKRTFIFQVIGNSQVEYISDSRYKAHFIVGDRWIDFEFGDNDATYSISRITNNNYQVSITTTKTDLNFNSVGDLNIVSVLTTFNIFSAERPTDLYKLGVCPVETLQSSLFFMFMVLLAFLIMIIALFIKNGLLGFLGAILLAILSLFFYTCIFAVGIVLTGLSIFLMSFFIFKGANGTL